MSAVFYVTILLAIIQPCLQFSIDRMLLKAMEKKDELVPKAGEPVSAELKQEQDWKNYTIPGMDGTYVKLQIDMILPREEAEKAFSGRYFTSREKRSAIRDKGRLWPNGHIPYSVDDAFDAEEKLTINNAIQHWMQHTCLKFVPALEKDHSVIKFVNNEDDGCFSFVGCLKLPQPISLQKACVHENIIIHEIGHAVGLFHEHSRPDRDAYVTIHYENIDSGIHPINFDKGNWSVYNNYGKPYDYLSIMHYGSTYFSKDAERNLETIVPKDSAFTNKIGKVKTISFRDAQIVNNMYSCSGGCNDIPCPDGGFLGMDCKCYCPGTDENTPIILCEKQDICIKPAIDQTVFDVYDEHAVSLVENLDKEFHNGTILRVFHSDSECKKLTCNNGSWDGLDTLSARDCVSCFLPESWRSEDGKAAGKVSNGTQVSISCPRTTNVIMGICDYDVLVNTETLGEIGEYSCCKDVVYRIIENDARGCLVSYDNQLEYSLEMDGALLREGDDIQHLQTIEAKCVNPNINNEFEEQDLRTTMTCIDGHWDNPPPSKCLKAANRPCSLVPNAILIGPFRNQDNGDTYSVDCIPGYELLDAAQGTNFTCKRTGEWEPKPPTCRHSSKFLAKKPCSLVINAVVSETSSKDTFTVRCIPGYDLDKPDSTQFSCAANGKWLPGTPFCKPRSCLIPITYTGHKLETEGMVNVIAGMSVDHAMTIRPMCDRGEVPTLSKVVCKLGEWYSAENKTVQSLPVCNEVVCATNSTFPVRSTNKSQRIGQGKYVYGDTILLANQTCKGILELVGPDTLRCQKDGQWSGSIACRKYCEHGKATFKSWKNKNMKVKRRDDIQFGDFKQKKCARRCMNEKRFLCRAISFGYKIGIGYICYLYAEVVEGETSLIDQPEWTVAERGCKPRR